MRAAYSILLYLATPFILLYFAARGLRDSRYLERWPERLGFVPGKVVRPRGILVHAASVGEVNAARALIAALVKDYPDLAVNVSTLTPTGAEQVRKAHGDAVGHCYIPIDVPGAVRRFLKRLEPRLIVIIETEIWPNLYRSAQRRAVPLIMANARLSERSLSRFRVASEFVADTLNRVAWIGAQSADDHRRLVECGADANNVRMTGNLKFDLDVPEGLVERAASLRRRWGKERPVLVAGSTHEADEAVVIAAFLEILQTRPDALLVLAPRRPERFKQVAQAVRDAGLATESYSQHEACSPQAQCFVIDAVGELLAYYACGDVAYVGGSMGNVGGHNALEPAALGVPVLFGPDMVNAREIANQLLSGHAAKQVNNTQELAGAVQCILGDPALRERMGRAGRALVNSNKGALDATLAAVRSLI